MFWIALAAQLAAAQETHRGIFSADDMPAYVQLGGKTLRTVIRVTVKPDGAIQACDIEDGSGDPKLDRYTCSPVLKRATFLPARWTDGLPVYGVARVPVVWAVGSRPSRESLQSGFNLKVNSLPKGVHPPAFQRIILGIDEGGRIVACDGDKHWSPGMDKNDPRLVQVACQELAKTYTAVPAKDGAGQPVRSVQNVRMRFNK